MKDIENIKINEIEYVRADSVPSAPVGNRAIVVVDRGWIFAGDVTRENGRIKLSRALHVFKWVDVGFAGIITNTKKRTCALSLTLTYQKVRKSFAFRLNRHGDCDF